MELDKYNDIDKIDENLYLGNVMAANNVEDLKAKGIKKVLTVMDFEIPKYDEKDFVHKVFYIEDYSGQNIIQYFGECLNFIKGEENVLVHCMAGASRSATIVIAYLMWTKKMKFDDALEFAKNKRSIVYPNRGFREQLKMFEKMLYCQNYNLDKIDFKGVKWEPTQDILFDS